MVATGPSERLTTALRFAVALGTLAIFFGDPSEHPQRRPLATAVLAAFALYSGLAYAVVVRRGRGMIPIAAAPWIDAGWVTFAVAVSQATSEIFYPLYLFAILYASFWGGFREGLSVAIASAGAFALVGAVTAPPGIDLRLFLVRPLYLLVLGYLTAVWGAHEIRSRARLALLREVTTLASPRSRVEPTLGRILEAIRGFFDADSCRLVIEDERAGGRRWTRAALRWRGPDAVATDLPPEIGEALLPEPADATLIVRAEPARNPAFTMYGPSWTREGDPAIASALLTALEAGALLSIPFRYHARASGRLYVARPAGRSFNREDAEFLQHVADQVVPVLENLRLVDHLASEVATDERRRIALDLHDSVIQPYLGLRLGLSAASVALASGRAGEAREHIDRLVHLADAEIQTLRGYVRGLRADEAGQNAQLEESVRRFCRRFSEATGIRVDVTVAGAPVGERIRTEVFQMVAEALSNVRRHTSAGRAEVRIETDEHQLRVTVANDGAPGPLAFLPRSLAERATALGGHLTIQYPGEGTTAVRVDVPL